MKLAMEEAQIAMGHGDVPIGAVLLGADKKVIARAHNQKETQYDPTGHAEILCLRQAGAYLKNWRLSGAILFTTLEPCPMCLFALLQARISKIIFGAYDLKMGALSLDYSFGEDQRFNHTFAIEGGLLHYENAQTLSRFFKQRRAAYRKPEDSK